MPEWAKFYSRLAAFSRLILFDKRGTDLSDWVANLEERMDNVRAVLDAVGSQRAALFDILGGPMSLLFAATYPQRVQALVLYGSYARRPLLTSEEYLAERIGLIDRLWGTGAFILGRFLPNLSVDEAQRRAWARFERQSASPPAAMATLRMRAEIDARHVLPAICLPTFIIHRVGDGAIPVEAGRYLADDIAAAKYLELPGDNHIPLNEPETANRIIGEVEEFLTGSRSEADSDRVLATVMFTDIVDSTKRADELSNREWRALRDRHDGAVRQLLTRFRGHEVKNLGDGFLARGGISAAG